jgi:branched-subunit amino acid transport protein
MNEFGLIAGMTLVTFGVRYPVLALVSRIPLPPVVLRALKYVPPAVLTAIILPPVLMPNGDSLNLQLSNAPLFASIVAVVVAWRSRNLLLTIVIGMLSLWLWRWGIGNFL